MNVKSTDKMNFFSFTLIHSKPNLIYLKYKVNNNKESFEKNLSYKTSSRY